MDPSPAVAALPAYKTLDAFMYPYQRGRPVSPESLEKEIDAVVKAFVDLARKAESELEDFLWDTYNAIFTVAKGTPYSRQTPLVQFVYRLRETTATGSDGQALHIKESVVWKDLPTFGWVARDLFNFGTPISPTFDEKAHSLLNLNHFFAELYGRAELDGSTPHPFDFSNFAVWTLRDVFEVEHPEGTDLGLAGLAAFHWLEQGLMNFAKLAQNDFKLEGKVGAPGSKFADRDWKGFEVDRVNVWAVGLKEMAFESDAAMAAEKAAEAAKAVKDATDSETKEAK
ncbi:hypothetical protein C8034_v005738 [Colletotrichum sidae]|uniref:Uncharacterized protein n=1 Tax=Colletotrichum sidae TaxID=1347389 RepID=A0A4R8T607_9PEZI|nr:hypothetical protein C8034_v005738 [Colletotrichum sidae]